MDSVYRHGIDTPLFSTVFDDFQMGSTAANSKSNDEEVRENSVTKITTTPESERPNETPDY